MIQKPNHSESAIQRICDMFASLPEDRLIIADETGRVTFLTPAMSKWLMPEERSDITRMFGRKTADILIHSFSFNVPTSIPFSKSGGRFLLTMTPCEGHMVIQIYEPDENDSPPMLDSEYTSFVDRKSRESMALMFAAADSLKKKVADDDAAKKALAVIRQGLFQMLRLSNTLADNNKSLSGELELHRRPGSLNQTLADIKLSLLEVEQKKSIRIDLELPDESVSGAFDRDQFERMLLTVLSMCLQGISAGSVISLRLAKRDEKAVITIRCPGKRANPVMRIQREVAIQTSLDLSLASSIASLHGGSLIYTNDPDGEMTIVIAVAAEPDATGDLSSAGTPYASGFNKALLELVDVLDDSFYM